MPVDLLKHMVKVFLQTSQAALLVNVTPTFKESERLEGWAISYKGYHAVELKMALQISSIINFKVTLMSRLNFIMTNAIIVMFLFFVFLLKDNVFEMSLQSL